MAWLNEFQGDIEQTSKKVKDFKIVQHNASKILGQVTLPSRNPDTFGKDIRRMTEESVTFAEILKSKNYTLIPKQRLKQVRDNVYEQLNALFPPTPTVYELKTKTA